jgi:hypothetical protein
MGTSNNKQSQIKYNEQLVNKIKASLNIQENQEIKEIKKFLKKKKNMSLQRSNFSNKFLQNDKGIKSIKVLINTINKSIPQRKSNSIKQKNHNSLSQDNSVNDNENSEENSEKQHSVNEDEEDEEDENITSNPNNQKKEDEEEENIISNHNNQKQVKASLHLSQNNNENDDELINNNDHKENNEYKFNQDDLPNLENKNVLFTNKSPTFGKFNQNINVQPKRLNEQSKRAIRSILENQSLTNRVSHDQNQILSRNQTMVSNQSISTKKLDQTNQIIRKGKAKPKKLKPKMKKKIELDLGELQRNYTLQKINCGYQIQTQRRKVRIVQDDKNDIENMVNNYTKDKNKKNIVFKGEEFIQAVDILTQPNKLKSERIHSRSPKKKKDSMKLFYEEEHDTFQSNFFYENHIITEYQGSNNRRIIVDFKKRKKKFTSKK